MARGGVEIVRKHNHDWRELEKTHSGSVIVGYVPRKQAIVKYFNITKSYPKQQIQ